MEQLSQGDLQQLKEALDGKRFQLNERTPSTGWTLLLYAAQKADFAKCELLLKRGADPNVASPGLLTPLMACSSCTSKGHEEVTKCCQLLLDAGAKVDALDRYHTTALMIASKNGNLSLVDALLKARSPLEIRDAQGFTALVWAVSKKRTEVAQVLMKAGAQHNVVTSTGDRLDTIAMTVGIADALGLESTNQSAAQQPAESTQEEESESAEQAGLNCKAPGGGDTQAGTEKASPNALSLGSSETDLNCTYRELELFLCTNELSELIPLFHKHKVSFSQLLQFDEDDYEKLGIAELGTRRKLADKVIALHKISWQASSIDDSYAISSKRKIEPQKALEIMANIARHTEYISSSITYLGKEFKSRPMGLRDPSAVEICDKLANETGSALKGTCSLYSQLCLLRAQLAEIKGGVDSRPPDLIDPLEIARLSKIRFSLFLLFGASSVAGLAGYTLYSFLRK